MTPPRDHRRHRLGAAARGASPTTSWPETRRHHRRMDRRADRHPRPPHRRRRRDHRARSPTEAARKALDAAGIDADEIGLIVLATATPDQTFPASATRVQTALGIDDCIAFDVAAVCTGFLYALSVADNMIKGGMADHALVIGAETFSRILDWEDRGDLRPVRRRRRRGRAQGRGERADRGHPRHPPPCRRPPQRSALCRRRRLRPPARSASCG